MIVVIIVAVVVVVVWLNAHIEIINANDKNNH